MSLTMSLKSTVVADLSKALDLCSGNSSLQAAFSLAMTDGTGANQVDRIFHDERTLAASATEDLDLSGGGLTDIYGTAFTIARLKLLVLWPSSANTNNVNLTRPASNGVPLFLAAGDGIAGRPGGEIIICAPDATGYAVTAGTGDLINLTNSAGTTSVTYKIILMGASA